MTTQQEEIKNHDEPDLRTPSDESIAMWRDLFKQSLNISPYEPSYNDPLSCDQRQLFEALTNFLVQYFSTFAYSEKP